MTSVLQSMVAAAYVRDIDTSRTTRHPDDGALDVALMTAWRWTQWLHLAVGLLLRRKTGHLARLPCRQLLVVAGRTRPWQVDGEVMGHTRVLRVTVQPGNLLVRVAPAAAPQH